MSLQLGRRRLQAALRRGGTGPSVAIIGAGLSGLGMAVQLQRAGVEGFTIFEQAGGVGGTWRENTYPGSGCDVPTHLYSFSFSPKHDWTRRFAGQEEILGYAEDLVRSHGLGPHLRLGTGISAARFDEGVGCWRLETTTGEEVTADVLVAAVGQLNRPAVPDLEGLETFAGARFHSARWDHGVELEGREVVVIGNGASAIQFVPEIAPRVKALTIFQRSSNYVVPKPDRVYGPLARFIFERVLPLELLYRWWIYWSFESRWFAFREGSAMGRHLERRFGREVRGQLVSEDLPEAVLVPDYPLGCKRILISNDWFPALLRRNVRVETSPVALVTPGAVLTEDGARHRAEVLIFATGFDTTHFLAPITVAGTGGRTLAEAWSDGAEAHLGLTVPGFPNLFLLYGPNTNLGHNSILFMVERQIEYVLACLAELSRRGQGALEIRPEVAERSGRAVQERLARTAWAGSCQSWYKTASGRVTNNWPGFTVAYWAETLWPKMADFLPLAQDRPASRTPVG